MCYCLNVSIVYKPVFFFYFNRKFINEGNLSFLYYLFICEQHEDRCGGIGVVDLYSWHHGYPQYHTRVQRYLGPFAKTIINLWQQSGTSQKAV